MYITCVYLHIYILYNIYTYTIFPLTLSLYSDTVFLSPSQSRLTLSSLGAAATDVYLSLSLSLFSSFGASTSRLHNISRDSPLDDGEPPAKLI